MSARRWLWLLLLALVVTGLVRLKFDAEVLNLLPRELPEVKGLIAYQDFFDGSDDLLITLKAEDADIAKAHAESLVKFLRSIDGLTGAVRWQPPWEEFPEQASELTAAMWFNQPPERLRELLERLEPAPLAVHLEELKAQLAISFSPEELARLSYDPLQFLDIPNAGDHGFMEIADDGAPFRSPMGDYRVVFVDTPHKLAGYKEAMSWLDSIEYSIATWRNQRIDQQNLPVIKLTGGPTFHSEISQGMERDMKRSVIGTALVVSVLFLLVHRRMKPLLWLLMMLAAVLAATMGVGGLLLGNLNVVSLGFAAILLGLAVDYGLVLYQERQAHPELDYRSARQLVAPGILWSAFTTAIAFGLLNLCGLPGLAQLGTLVSIGVLIAAMFMLLFFLRPLESVAAKSVSVEDLRSSPTSAGTPGIRLCMIVTVLLTIVAGAVLLVRPPIVDATSKPLRPARSLAYDAMDEFEDQVSNENGGWSVVVNGNSEQAVADELKRLRRELEVMRVDQVIVESALPDAIWANPNHQNANRESARKLMARKAAVFQQVRDAGFTDDSLELAGQIFGGWEQAVSATNHYWPDNPVSKWVLGQSTSRTSERFIAAGRIQPASNLYGGAWEDVIQNENVWIAGWDRLGPALMSKVKARLQWVSVLICLAVVGVLMMTFRTVREVLLSLCVLGFSGLVLLAAMSLMEWEWNLMNLMAIPLLLGGTVDYTIHTQLSLRRNGGNTRKTFHSTGKALLLCAATTAVGFGSLGFSNNAGLASLGKVCSVGAICSVLVACFLLPSWWKKTMSILPAKNVLPRKPSKLYGATCWKLARVVVRILPLRISRSIGVLGATMYALLARRRSEVVSNNLLPVVDDNQRRARSTSRKLFRLFGEKIVDLLYFENGGAVRPLLRHKYNELSFEQKDTEKRGTLLLTIHLGNWEYGAPMLKEQGVDLLVMTMAEPGEGFTELRQAARARWGIETIVIGDDSFAFVEVLKRLEEGAVVALLLDRPPESSGVEVELFGRPFKASSAAAELARASGCSLVPVIIPMSKAGYEAIALPEVKYDRRSLGSRDTRRELTQEIMRAFEPWIRQYPDQWFHFVPIWPESSAS